MTHGNWLELIDGTQYWLNAERNDPDALRFEMSVADLARQLSQINRFNGATRLPYSVAQHSVWVSLMLDLDAEWALYGLLHDAHEVIVSDIARPVKLEMRERGASAALDALVKEADARIFGAFGLAYPLPPRIAAIVGHADDVALATERRDLMAGTAPWSHLPAAHPSSIVPLPADEVAKQFVGRFNNLMARFRPDEAPAAGAGSISDVIDILIPKGAKS